MLKSLPSKLIFITGKSNSDLLGCISKYSYRFGKPIPSYKLFEQF